MENYKTNSATAFQNGQSKEKTTNYPRLSPNLMKLFEDEIKEISWAENMNQNNS